jgi:CheY-like chemotaxis protein
MKRVLVVDDDAMLLGALTKRLKSDLDSLTILTAANGREAMDLLGTEPVDLLITDLEMPEVDGFQLLAYVQQRHPDLPVIVMTGLPLPSGPDVELPFRGSLECVEKPFGLALFKNRILRLLDGAMRGRVENISLASFVQLIELEQKTCLLHVKSAGRRGELFFEQGALVEAKLESVNGRNAALEILSWEKANIDILRLSAPPPRTIEESSAFLLMEAARIKDERLAAATKRSPPKS